MKTIMTIIILLLILFCSCTQTENVGVTPPVSVEDSSGSSLPSVPAETLLPEKDLPYEFLLSSDFDRSQGITIPSYNFSGEPVAFDFGELSLDEYPYGEWSVEKLERKYGKAEEVRGSLSWGDILVSATWLDLYVLLQTTGNGTMSFDIDSNSTQEMYPLSAQDRAIMIPVKKIHLYNDILPLPRGLKIGESTIDEVKAVYPVEGNELNYNTHTITYKYLFFDEIAIKQEIERDDVGYLIFYFGDEVLSAVEIGWKAA